MGFAISVNIFLDRRGDSHAYKAMRTKIKGPKRFLVAGILFGLGALMLFVNFTGAKLYALYSFPAGMAILSAMLIWFYVRAKRGADPLKQSMSLYVGFLFTWLGGSFLGAAFLVPADKVGQVIIPSTICLLAGIGILIGVLVSRRRAAKGELTDKEVRKSDSKVGAVIGLIVAIIVVVPLLVLAGIAVYHQRWVPALVLGLPPLLLIVITILVKRFGKKGRLKYKKEIASGD